MSYTKCNQGSDSYFMDIYITFLLYMNVYLLLRRKIDILLQLLLLFMQEISGELKGNVCVCLHYSMYRYICEWVCVCVCGCVCIYVCMHF